MKAKPTPALLILLIERTARKSYVLVTQDVFLGFEDPVLSCLTESGPQNGVPTQNADDVSVWGTRLVEEHQLHNWDPILA